MTPEDIAVVRESFQEVARPRIRLLRSVTTTSFHWTQSRRVYSDRTCTPKGAS